jgi:methyl-accepting chemotaxis protein
VEKSLKNSITIKIGLGLVIVLTVVFSLLIMDFREAQVTRINKEITETIKNVSLNIDAQNEKLLNLIDTMATYQEIAGFGNREESIDFLNETLQNNQEVLGTYFIYEPNADDQDEEYTNQLSKAHTSNGRFAPYWSRSDEEIVLSPVTGMADSNFYQQPKRTGETVITEPFIYQGVMMTSFVTPIEIEDQFSGIAGVDYSLTDFQTLLKNLAPFETARFYLFSKNNKVIATSDEEDLLTRNLSELDEYKSEFAPLLEETETKVVNSNESETILASAPIETGGWKVIMTVQRKEILSAVNRATTKLIFLGIAAVVILSGLLYWLIRRSLLPLNDLQDRVEKIASQGGDLTQRLKVESEDEVGKLAQSFNKLLSTLQTMVTEIYSETEEIASASQQLSASSEEGNAVVETTAGNIEDMSAGIEEISASSQEVTSFSEHSNKVAQEGRERIEEAMEQFKTIESVVETSTNNMKQLNQIVEEVEGINKLITEIAEQTNLLALNASIEAARAGEDGHGFAVVAEEIKELAEETGEATDNIDSLIKEIHQKSEKTLETIENSNQEVAVGNKLITEAEKSFVEIKENIEETADQIQQTSASAEELAANSDEINTATEEVREVVEEVTKASTDLADNAQKLQEMVNQFKV